MILVKQERNGYKLEQYFENIIRKVSAETKEEAIGKFTLSTAYVKAEAKYGVECINLEELKQID